MPFLEVVSKCIKCPAERVTLVEHSSKFDPTTIRDGVVIFFAEWSAPAHVALKSYTETLSHLNEGVPVWILNVDDLTVEVDEKFKGAKHGYAETFFIQGSAQVDQLLSLDGDYGKNFQLKWQKLFGDK